jgi:hypothetical protein
MTHEEARAYFVRRQTAWREADARALTDDHDEDCTVTSPIFATIHGRAAIQRSYESLFRTFSAWDVRHDDPLLDGNRIALPFTARAVHVGEFMGLQGTNRRFEVAGVLLFEMRDAKIIQERRLYDFTALLIQTGVLRGKPCI